MTDRTTLNDEGPTQLKTPATPALGEGAGVRGNLLYQASDVEMFHVAEAMRDITSAISALMDATGAIRGVVDGMLERRFAGTAQASPEVGVVDQLAARRALHAGSGR